MRLYIFLTALCLCSCSTNRQIQYINDASSYVKSPISYSKYTIQPYDILKIDVHSSNLEAALPYNKPGAFNNRVANATLQSLQLEGYLVSNEYTIDFPILGLINVKGKTIKNLEQDIKSKLISEKHLLDPLINIRLLNACFTVLGEVKNPGTFLFVEDRISVLQALGFAGDITVEGLKKNICIIREVNKKRSIHKLDLTKTSSLNEDVFYIKPNDIIIVPQNYKKVKSAGFLGDAQSISSLASIFLSIVLLIIN